MSINDTTNQPLYANLCYILYQHLIKTQYVDLYHMILRAYIDLYAVQTIGENNSHLCKDSCHIVNHINHLLKCDLALTIWKISIDTNPNANTIQHLHLSMRKKRSDRPRFSMSDSLKTDINNIRKKYLAHDDFKKSGVTLQISALSPILNELKNWLNLLYTPNIDDQVRKITNKDLQQIKKNTEMGLKRLLVGDSHA